ncbi:hypothetical protein JW933_04305 [candidate division FCPU426 bacterium]|nr:hypothetical protein [candidate division FCPU426 bacterium]
MELTEILALCRSLKIVEEREVASDHINLVLLTEDLRQWSECLALSLGPALKAAGAKPSSEAKKIAQNFGGIRNEQTLFIKNFDDFSVVAMFWPWQDNKHTTLKIFKTVKIEYALTKRKWWFG